MDGAAGAVDALTGEWATAHFSGNGGPLAESSGHPRALIRGGVHRFRTARYERETTGLQGAMQDTDEAEVRRITDTVIHRHDFRNPR